MHAQSNGSGLPPETHQRKLPVIVGPWRIHHETLHTKEFEKNILDPEIPNAVVRENEAGEVM